MSKAASEKGHLKYKAEDVIPYIEELAASHPYILRVYISGSRAKGDWKELDKQQKDWDFTFECTSDIVGTSKAWGSGAGYHIDIDAYGPTKFKNRVYSDNKLCQVWPDNYHSQWQEFHKQGNTEN